MYVSRIVRYPQTSDDPRFDLNVVEGTERFNLFFDGPADETLSQLQTPSLFFYSETRKARQAYRAKLARLDKATAKLPSEQRASLRTMFALSRNVVTLWERPDVPQRLRAIVRGCLRP
jgi:hypothetical protein